MTTHACGCRTEAETTTLERPRYYPRQLVTPDDMTLEQDYFRQRLRLHNRLLHGWGVVCGAQVEVATKAWHVIVKQGYVLGPYGDEIYIEKDQCINVNTRCGDPEVPSPEDECVEAPPPPNPEEGLFVAIRYKAFRSRLVRVPFGGCGCDETVCEHSRWRDGFEICILDHCPKQPDPPAFDDLKQGKPPACAPCPDEPWVVLAGISVDAAGQVTINACECRRQVLACGPFSWHCTP
jgi:hypothetical protein